MRYWDLVEPIWNKVSIYDGPKMFLTQFAAVPPRQRTLLAAHWCQSEVCNGGLEQFFRNSTGVLCPEAVRAFRTIGMTRTSKALTAAMKLFGAPYPRHRGQRNARLKSIDQAALDRLDQEFFKALESESSGFEAAADRYAGAGKKR